MASKSKPDERLGSLESVVDEVSGQLATLEGRLQEVGLGDVDQLALRSLRDVPLLLLSCLKNGDAHAPQDSGLSISAQAGIAVSRAETSAAEAELESDDLEALLPIRDSSTDAQKAAGARQARRLARAVKNALSDGKDAKDRVAGAAAEARKFGPARPKIVEAENSFKLAESFVRSAEKAIQQGRINQAASTLKDAQQKVAADIDHLKDALEAIEGE